MTTFDERVNALEKKTDKERIMAARTNLERQIEALKNQILGLEIALKLIEGIENG